MQKSKSNESTKACIINCNKLIILFTSAFILLLASCTDINFNSSKWKAWNERTGKLTLRWDMCDDLIEEHLSIGMERARIVELLGEPSSDCIQSDCDMIYELGPCRRGINYGSLYLSFKNNRLIEIFKHCG